MSDDPKFKNPSLDGSWTGGLIYWKCPRCHSEDVYKAKRQVGNIGTFHEIGDSENFMGVQRPMNLDVWICRKCGETATKFKRQRTAQETAEEKALTKSMMTGSTPFLIAGGFLFLIAMAASVIFLVVQISSL